jgi:hypothetical protein
MTSIKRRKMNKKDIEDLNSNASISSSSMTNSEAILDEDGFIAGENNKSDEENFNYKADHSNKLLMRLDSMRNNESMCDYEIKCNGESFLCHKCILIAMSDFFKAMLTGIFLLFLNNYYFVIIICYS